jgi:hypothetical protein
MPRIWRVLRHDDESHTSRSPDLLKKLPNGLEAGGRRAKCDNRVRQRGFAELFRIRLNRNTKTRRLGTWAGIGVIRNHDRGTTAVATPICMVGSVATIRNAVCRIFGLAEFVRHVLNSSGITGRI